MTGHQQLGHAHGALVRVPLIGVAFWVVKALSTAAGESVSDYLVHTVGPVPAVVLGFVAFLAALGAQLTRRRYVPWSYWLCVLMVGVFGTMAADVVHVALGVPYVLSALVYGLALAAVFLLWWRVEGTLSVHEITSARRELFYWAAVVATFALGTAAGDLAAYSLHLGYGLSIVLFAVLILVPAWGFFRWNWNPVTAFWTAYVLTRPLGASVADWLGKPAADGGLGVGSGAVSVVLLVAIAALVAYLARSRADRPALPALAAEER